MDRVDAILAQWADARPELDTGPMGLIGRVLRIQRHLMRGMEQTLAAHGLTFAGFDVLATLRRAGHPDGLAPGALLAEMMVTSGTMTHRVDQLVAQGLVERRPNPADGRGVIVRLTAHGLATVDAAVVDHVARQAELVAGLDPEARAVLLPHLRRWLDALDRADLPTAGDDRPAAAS